MSETKRQFEIDNPQEYAAETVEPFDPQSSADFETQYAKLMKVLDERTLELFNENPVCWVCKKPITSFIDARLVQLTDGPDYLAHDSSECFTMSVHRMAERFFQKPRRATA
jgi:hypothetical protein